MNHNSLNARSHGEANERRSFKLDSLAASN